MMAGSPMAALVAIPDKKHVVNKAAESPLVEELLIFWKETLDLMVGEI